MLSNCGAGQTPDSALGCKIKPVNPKGNNPVYSLAGVMLKLQYFGHLIVLSVSRSVVPNLLRPHGLQPTRLLCPWDFPGKRGCHFLLQGIFPRDWTWVSCTAGGFFTNWAARANSLEKTQIMSKIEGRRRWQRTRWMTSSPQWTWIWANSGRRLSTGKPGVLQPCDSTDTLSG